MREAIVNAVMHRTYRTHGAIQIIRYSNRVEIRNPGHSLVAEDYLGEPGSKTRNPKIAAVLHETRFAETKGSGIRVMREMMGIANLSPPAFESDRGRDHFVATFLFHHFLDQGDMSWLAQFRDYSLTDDEAKALVFVREVGGITEVVYRHLTQVSRMHALRQLEHLENLGLLQRRGRGERGLFQATDLIDTPNISALHQSSQASSLGVQTPELTPVSPELGNNFDRAKNLPDELVAEIEQLGQRPVKQHMQRIILLLCAWQPFTAEQLANVLGRRRDYLHTNYLRPMVKEGELYYTVPAHPHSPKQAYTTQPQPKGV